MGRGYNYATCLEGALKVKELSYMHCEGIMSGELKHGPLAMVDETMPIVMIVCKDQVYTVSCFLFRRLDNGWMEALTFRRGLERKSPFQKSLNALQQVVARKGRPIIICDDRVPDADLCGLEHVLRVPHTVDCVQVILTVIPMQLLSYHLAELRGQNVSQFVFVLLQKSERNFGFSGRSSTQFGEIRDSRVTRRRYK